ncbi:stalk domain-containing protein, partial [Peptoniphilus sp.]|uniref:stalk domain-containing protein n=1 Tax=Peptoniphilus sp. TaxID=1971214 RepID=UPI003991689D
LDDQEKKDFKDKVDEQTDKPGVDKVVEEAKKKDQENKDKKDLDDYKEKAKEEIGNLPNLDDQEKKDFKDKVDEQTDKPGVDKVVEEAKKAAEKTPGQDPKVVGPVDPTDPNGGKPADTSKYYVVTFVSSDTEKGTVAAKNTVYVLKTETKTLAEITTPEKTAKTGYEFDKWEPALDANTIITGDMEVKAYFKASGTTPTPPPTPTPEPTPSYPGYEYNPFWSIYFGSGTATTNKTIEPQKKIVMKLQTKLVIGSKEMIKSVDGVEQKVMMDIAPFIESNRTMLPIRFVAEALGFKVEWDDPSRTVILTDKDNVVKIPVDTNKIIVNGEVYESDVKPVLRNNRTMLLIGNIARALGLKDGTDIIWDAATRTVVIKREIEK